MMAFFILKYVIKNALLIAFFLKFELLILIYNYNYIEPWIKFWNPLLTNLY